MELLPNLGILPIFKECDLYPYKGSPIDIGQPTLTNLGDDDWIKDIPPTQLLQLESILDSKVIKKTRNGTYKTYLLKWKVFLDVETTWMMEANILKHGVTIEDLLTQGT